MRTLTRSIPARARTLPGAIRRDARQLHARGIIATPNALTGVVTVASDVPGASVQVQKPEAAGDPVQLVEVDGAGVELSRIALSPVTPEA